MQIYEEKCVVLTDIYFENEKTAATLFIVNAVDTSGF